MSMSVLLLHWGRQGGGPKFTLELARGLQATSNLRLHLSLACYSELFAASRDLSLPGFHVDAVQGRRGTLGGLLKAVTAVPRLLALPGAFGRYLEENEIDVVLSTMGTVWHAAVLGAVARSRAAFVHIVHDAVAHPGDRYPFRHTMAAREIRASDGVIALSAHVREQVRRIHGVPDDRIWLARHGVFEYGGGAAGPRRYPVERPFRLLFFGRIAAYKGLGHLLAAYELLRARRPAAASPRVELRVVGSGALQPYKAQLARLSDVQVENGWIAEDAIGRILEEADAIVMPYIEASQSGVAALAYGSAVPIIATPVGGLVEQLRHEETGLLAADMSVEALADALERMVTDAALYERCSAGARAFAQTELSWKAIAGDVERCLYQVSRRPRAAREGASGLRSA